MDEHSMAIRLIVRNRYTPMSRKDVESIINIGRRFVNTNIDFLECTNVLRAYGIIDNDMYRKVRRIMTSAVREDRFVLFLKHILCDASFDDLVNVLYKVGLTAFADELVQDRYGDKLNLISKADMPHAHFVQRFYCQMKQNVDNGVFRNPRQFLEDFSMKLKFKIQQNVDPDTRQFLAEKLVAVYALRLPQYPAFRDRTIILNDMRDFFENPDPPDIRSQRYLPPRVDSTSAEIVFNSKMAITAAKCGDFEAAQRHACHAESLGFLYKSSLASTLAFHDHQYIYRQDFLKTGHQTSLGKVLSLGDNGLRALMDEDDEVRHQWNRLFMLYKTLSLLGIYPDFKMSKSFPSVSEVEQARTVLREFQWNFNNIECRREMIYKLCMARTHEQSGVQRLETAIDYVNDAIRLSRDCIPFMPAEKQNIYRYMRTLKQRRMVLMVLNWIASLPIYVYALIALSIATLYTFLYLGSYELKHAGTMDGHNMAVRLIARSRYTPMSQEDIKSIIKIGRQFVNTDIDFLECTNFLRAYGVIDNDKYRQVRRLLIDAEHTDRRFVLFLEEILGDVTFDDFVNAIYKQNLTSFAKALVRDRYGDILTRIDKADMPHAHVVQRFYCKMKQKVDNGNFQDPRQELEDLSMTLKTEIRNRQFFAEKLVAVYALRISQFPALRDRSVILEDMQDFFRNPDPPVNNQRYLPPRVDATSANIVYSSKMAITAAIGGDFEAAQRHARHAESIGSLYNPSLATTLAFHDHQYIFRREFMKTGHRKKLGKVLSLGDNGLRALMDEDDDVRHQWNRFFMLYKTLSLLGIYSDFKMCKEYPSVSEVEQARTVLQEFRGSYTGIESRRKMIYSLCMARTHEQGDVESLETAIDYVNDAIRLSQDCTSFMPAEEQNIHRYLRTLKQRRMTLMVLKWSASISMHIYAIILLGIVIFLYTVI